MLDTNCIFCRIIAGEIPCAKVYEDKAVLAFLDLSPAAKGHTLVIPKEHYADLEEFPPEKAPEIFNAAKKIGAALMKATGATGCHVVQNNGVSAGQTMFHIHWHIIPRKEGDGLTMWKQGSYEDSTEMNALAKKIALALNFN